jgi:hypothetical protein
MMVWDTSLIRLMIWVILFGLSGLISETRWGHLPASACGIFGQSLRGGSCIWHEQYSWRMTNAMGYFSCCTMSTANVSHPKVMYHALLCSWPHSNILLITMPIISGHCTVNSVLLGISPYAVLDIFAASGATLCVDISAALWPMKQEYRL